MFKYIQSRFYRSPEVILELDYGPAADMWSCGCILVELLTGDPLFPGEDEYDQLHKIVEVLGMPPLHMIEGSPKKNKLFAKRVSETSGRHYWELRKARTRPLAGRSLDSILGVPPTIERHAPRAVQSDGIARLIFKDLVSRMLSWDPAQRIGALEALHHYFFSVDEIVKYILDSNTLRKPSRLPTIPIYGNGSNPNFTNNNNNSGGGGGMGGGHSGNNSGGPNSLHSSSDNHSPGRHYVENALREASRMLDKRMPGIATSAVTPPPPNDVVIPKGFHNGMASFMHDPDDEEDVFRQLNNMSISPPKDSHE
jgi:dual specificity tyrosine-phosphorylation-regulated kinase 1